MSMATSPGRQAAEPSPRDSRAPSQYAQSTKSKASAKSKKSAHRLSLRRIFSRKEDRERDEDAKRNSYYEAEGAPPVPQISNGRPVSNGFVSTISTMESRLNGASIRRASVGGTTNGDVKPKKKKQYIISAFVEMCSGHQSPGLWRHPDDQSHRFNEVKYWMDLAKTLEAGKFHCMFIADVLGGYDVYGGPRNLEPAVRSGAQWPVNEPLSVVPAMAAVTDSISFGVTVSTTYEQPYHLARRLSTVDHLTNGRVGWNVVTGYLDSAARNLGRKEQPDHDERYKICNEYMQVTYKLWQSSWRDGAVVRNRKSAVYTYPERVREINHKGKYFEVPGPHICQPSPQRTPVIMQAGTSKAGKEFAARHAEAIFVSGHSPPAVAKNIRDIREQSAKEGRDPQSIKFLAKICPVIGRTREEAEAKYQEYLSYGSEEGALALFGGWTGVDMAQYGEDEELRYVESNAIRSYIEGLMKTQPKAGKWTKKTLAEHVIVGGLGATPVGTPSEVADEFERWVDEADVDGFNIAYALMPQTFTDVIELLLPELRRRGLFWDDYTVPQGTYRENLHGIPGQEYPLSDHPASKYLWRAGEPKDTPIWDAEDSARAEVPHQQTGPVHEHGITSQPQSTTPKDVQSTAVAQSQENHIATTTNGTNGTTTANNDYFDSSQQQQSEAVKYRAATPPPPGFVPGPMPGVWVRNEAAVPPTPSVQSYTAPNGTAFSSLDGVTKKLNGNSSTTSRSVSALTSPTSAKPAKPNTPSFSLGPAWSRVRDDAQPDGVVSSYGGGNSSEYAYVSNANGAVRGSTYTAKRSKARSAEVDELMARIMEHGADEVLAEDGYIDPTAVQFA